MSCNSSNSCFCSNVIPRLTEIKSDILTGSVEDFRLLNKSLGSFLFTLIYKVESKKETLLEAIESLEERVIKMEKRVITMEGNIISMLNRLLYAQGQQHH